MLEEVINQQLLDKIRRAAKKKSREEKTATYNQWLDRLSGKYGFTYTSLKRRVEELERIAHEERLAREKEIWEERLSQSLVWGDSSKVTSHDEGLPLPVTDGNVPWPHCFSSSSLFSVDQGPRKTVSGSVFTLDGPEMFFQGETLSIADDQTLLMAFIMVAGRSPCGRLIEFSLAELESIFGCPLPRLGMPIEYQTITRTLWRLTHCKLTVPSCMFDGPILLFADARQVPSHFKIRFNPDFANFYYPWLALLRNPHSPSHE